MATRFINLSDDILTFVICKWLDYKHIFKLRYVCITGHCLENFNICIANDWLIAPPVLNANLKFVRWVVNTNIKIAQLNLVSKDRDVNVVNNIKCCGNNINFAMEHVKVVQIIVTLRMYGTKCIQLVRDKCVGNSLERLIININPHYDTNSNMGPVALEKTENMLIDIVQNNNQFKALRVFLGQEKAPTLNNFLCALTVHQYPLHTVHVDCISRIDSLALGHIKRVCEIFTVASVFFTNGMDRSEMFFLQKDNEYSVLGPYGSHTVSHNKSTHALGLLCKLRHDITSDILCDFFCGLVGECDDFALGHPNTNSNVCDVIMMQGERDIKTLTLFDDTSLLADEFLKQNNVINDVRIVYDKHDTTVSQIGRKIPKISTQVTSFSAFGEGLFSPSSVEKFLQENEQIRLLCLDYNGTDELKEAVNSNAVKVRTRGGGDDNELSMAHALVCHKRRSSSTRRTPAVCGSDWLTVEWCDHTHVYSGYETFGSKMDEIYWDIMYTVYGI